MGNKKCGYEMFFSYYTRHCQNMATHDPNALGEPIRCDMHSRAACERRKTQHLLRATKSTPKEE